MKGELKYTWVQVEVLVSSKISFCPKSITFNILSSYPPIFCLVITELAGFKSEWNKPHL